MSDEEKEGEEYVRHPPSYRSGALNTFISKLDERLDTTKDKHPRVGRRLGSPHQKPVPEGCKKWLVKGELRSDQLQSSVTSETSSSGLGSDRLQPSIPSEASSSGSEELL